MTQSLIVWTSVNLWVGGIVLGPYLGPLMCNPSPHFLDLGQSPGPLVCNPGLYYLDPGPRHFTLGLLLGPLIATQVHILWTRVDPGFMA